jgi:hypothetical protein
MTPDDDPRWRDGITSAVAALQAGERHSIEDREVMRREVRDSEARIRREAEETKASILRAVEAVDRECKQFHEEAKDTWGKRDEGRRAVTIAWIGGAFLLIAAILNTIATLFS